MSEIGWYREGDVLLREEPARDACFTVVRRDAEMHEYPPDAPESRREPIHRHMSNEITSLDIAAQCLVDFPDAPWDLRMELARQCWDESRHVAALKRRFEQMGGRIGEFPVSAFEWSVTIALDDLAGRLASQNRTFEAGAMDVVAKLVQQWREIGDEQTAEVLESILADEVQHVRFANRWIKKMAQQNPRVLMKVAAAVRFIAQANAALQHQPGETGAAGKVLVDPTQIVPPVNIEDRKLAEFSDEEIHEILRQAGFRTIIPDERATV